MYENPAHTGAARYTSQSYIVAGNPSCSSTLHLFNLFRLVFCMTIPYGSSIFQLRPDNLLYVISLTPGCFVLMFLRTKFRVLVALPVILSMWEFQDRSVEISTPQISCTGSSFQDLTMNAIICIYMFPGPCHLNNLALQHPCPNPAPTQTVCQGRVVGLHCHSHIQKSDKGLLYPRTAVLWK